MAINYDDLDQFHQFALGKLSNGGADSVSQLAAEWEARREFDETVAELRECAADMEAGVGRPFAEVDAELRQKHGFAPRNNS
jgi:hypothetical protein